MTQTRPPRTVAPYGSWSSPIPIQRLTDGAVFLAEPHAARGIRWWLEGRPEEAGRPSLVRRGLGGTITPQTQNQ